MTFEWDENKNLDNIEKHGVSFEMAQEAFFDKNRIILKDIRIIGAGYWREGRYKYEKKYNLH